jgi:cytoskeleton protein RodZ
MTSFGGSAFTAATAALVPERTGPRWGLAVSGAAAALAAIIAVGYANQPETANQQLTGLPAATPSPTASPTPAVQTPAPNAVAAKPVVSGAQLRIRLVNGRSWVSVSDSVGKTLFEGLLEEGEFRDFSDPTKLKILLGNARAVSLNCDGTDSGPSASSKSVARFSCTPAGLTAL